MLIIETDDLKFPPICLAMLRSDKNYRKLTKKQTKELECLERRHEKEATAMLRAHSLLTDKLNATHNKAIAFSTSSLRSAPQKWVCFFLLFALIFNADPYLPFVLIHILQFGSLQFSNFKVVAFTLHFIFSVSLTQKHSFSLGWNGVGWTAWALL